MKSNNTEIIRSVIVLMLFISIALLLAIADRAHLHLEKDCECVQLRQNVESYVLGVTEQTSSGPYVYRILIPYIILGIQSLFSSLSMVGIDFLLKVFFLILCQLNFYYYLRSFFSGIVSLMGVIILDVLLSFTFSSILGPSVVETSDIFNLVIFIFALQAIHKNNFLQFLLLIFIGTVNRETTWFLFPVFFLYDFKNKKKIYRTIIVFVIIAVTYYGLRLLIHSDDATWFTFEKLTHNFPFLSSELTTTAFIANFHTAIFLLPFIILTAMNFKKHPEFLRTAVFITPLFIVVHYFLGSIIETRLWLPLIIVLLPTSLNTLNLLFEEKINIRSNHQEVLY
ncbi:MAG: hypothetical protein IH618_12695 [Ignavibacteriaceae bacterium]|nr:hypothetical protein [Ignavibacteriaceae bacterium]